MDRRTFIAAASATVATACSAAEDDGAPGIVATTTDSSQAPPTSTSEPTAAVVASEPHLASTAASPFGVGVASGDPTSDGVTIWTRLADVDGSSLGGGDQLVAWEVATEPDFVRVVQRGDLLAEARHGHSVRIAVGGLGPGFVYYRFRLGEATSVIGRTRTMAAATGRPFRLALLSCQHYEEGWFTAHRHVVDDEPDLVVHVGDYIYGRPGTAPTVRSQPVHGPVDLADYRSLYSTYRADPHLQMLHAAAPFVAVWDDHEVTQNDVGTVDNPSRASAYRAWWEFQPTRVGPPDEQGRLRIHRKIDIADMARLWLLDGRQYRSPQVCERSDVLPAFERCEEVDDESRTMLGADQERWLDEGVADDGRWDVFAQQTVMADLSLRLGGVTGINNDQWDGYAAARSRFLATASSNPRSVVLSGDIHAAMANVIRDSGSEVAEFVAPSVTTRRR